MEFNDSQFTVEKTLSQEDKRALHTMEQSVRLCVVPENIHTPPPPRRVTEFPRGRGV